MVDDFLAGIEIDGAGTADSEAAEPATDSVGFWIEATGTTPSRPVIELNPRNAVTTNSKERATLEDLAASSDAFL
jgi:hypothetical protein